MEQSVHRFIRSLTFGAKETLLHIKALLILISRLYTETDPHNSSCVQRPVMGNHIFVLLLMVG